MIIKLQITNPYSLSNEDGSKGGCMVLPETGNRIDFEGVLGEGWMGTDGIRYGGGRNGGRKFWKDDCVLSAGFSVPGLPRFPTVTMQ